MKLIRPSVSIFIVSNLILLAMLQIFNACGMNEMHNPSPAGEGKPFQNTIDAKGPFYNPQIYNLFKEACSSCHNSVSSLPNWLDYNVAYQKRSLVYSRVVTKKDMPQGRSMSEADRALIAAWVEAGAPLQAPGDTTPIDPGPGPTTPTDPPVDGGWSAWEEGQSCSKSCGGGVRTEIRTCTSPTPRNGGLDCVGPSEQSLSCNEQVCVGIPIAVDGVWSNWESVGACSASCGSALQTQKRSCNNPSPVNGGLNCVGEKTRQVDCNMGPCTGDIGYNEQIKPLFQVKCSMCHNENSAIPNWLQYEVAFAKKDAINNRVFIIKDMPMSVPMTATERKLVSDWVAGGAKQSQPPIPVHGGWTEFTNSAACSKDCGGGLQPQSRTCTNPAPANGGQDCAGATTRNVYCAMIPCNEGDPIPGGGTDGGWSIWSDSTTCSRTCGGGVKNQIRSCTDPAPSNGGKDCEGPTTREIECNTQACPVNGGWGNWLNSGDCSATCGGGLQNQTRYCDSPTPANGGESCAGENTRALTCNSHVCPVIVVKKIECSNVFNRIYIEAEFSPIDGVVWFGADVTWWWVDLPFANGKSTMQGGGFIISCPATVKFTTNRGGWLEFPVRILD